MRKTRFTEHRIIAVLKSVETGRTVKDVCRKPVSLKSRTTTRKQSMAVWKPLISER